MKISIFKYLALSVVGLLLLNFSCRDIQKVKNILPYESLVVKSLVSQSFIPGIESNLKKSIKYEWEISGDFNLQIAVTNLIVDSVKVPFSSLSVGSQNQVRYPIIRTGVHDSIKVTANRLVFNRNSQYQMIPEIALEGHNYKVPEGEALMEYSIGDELYTMPLGIITIKQTVYNP